MENVVRIEDLAACVEQTILEVQRGVAKARSEGGIIVDLPKEITFSATVVKEWQALEMSGGQTAETTEEQGGGNKEVVKGTEVTDQMSKATDSKTDVSKRTNSGKTVTSDQQVTTSHEKRAGKEGGSVNDTTTRTGSENSVQNNAHNQTDVEEYTYESA